ncbi:hypothetical protein E4U54_008011 [Claviceps lovelessii]|nr:hypothetical protein E4U54_008011 [Claviceps lovelessii]
MFEIDEATLVGSDLDMKSVCADRHAAPLQAPPQNFVPSPPQSVYRIGLRVFGKAELSLVVVDWSTLNNLQRHDTSESSE